MLKTLLKISLLVIIPLAILGFGAFEKTGYYDNIFKIKGVESALTQKLTTNFGEPKRLVITRQENSEEFDHLWSLIKKNTKYKLPDWQPEILSRIAIENGSSVILPETGKVVLIPSNVPVVALKVRPEVVSRGKATKEDMFMVGTVGEIQDWLNKKKSDIRLKFDLFIAIFSIILGLAVEFGLKDKKISQPNIC